jgi:hypothetical protein
MLLLRSLRFLIRGLGFYVDLIHTDFIGSNEGGRYYVALLPDSNDFD